MSKISLLIALFASPTMAWSSGFYLGLGAGPQSADFNSNATVSRPGDFQVNNNNHLSGTGAFGSIFGGYAWMRQAFYLAGEANFDVSNLKFQTSNNEFLHQKFSTAYYRLRHNWGLSVLPGYLFTPSTLFYGRLGYSVAYFNISSADISLSNVNQNLSGINFGVGINQALNQQIAVRMEYNQVHYQSTSTTSFDPVGNVTKNTNIAPTVGQVEFALLYRF